MSEILEAIKVWEKENSAKINELDVAKKNAISQALNFFNKKFGGEGELMPIIAEEPNEIVEQVITKESKVPILSIEDVDGLKKYKNWTDFNNYVQDYYKIVPIPNLGYDKWKFRFTWENGDVIEDRIDVGFNSGDYNPLKQPINEYIKETYLKENISVMYKAKVSDVGNLSFDDESSKSVQNQSNLIGLKSINIWTNDNQIKPFESFEDAQTFLLDKFNFGNNGNKMEFAFQPVLVWEDGSTITARNDIRVNDFELESFDPKTQKLNKYLFALYVLGENKIGNRILENKNFYVQNSSSYFTSWDWGTQETLQKEEPKIEEKISEEEIVFADLEELENEIESINFEELENIDKELDDLF
jgi:hypothetical protein